MIVSVSDADELLLSLSRKRRRQSVNAEDDNDRKEGDELNPGHELDVEMQQQMILVQDEKGGCGALYCDAISLFSLNPDELKAARSIAVEKINQLLFTDIDESHVDLQDASSCSIFATPNRSFAKMISLSTFLTPLRRQTAAQIDPKAAITTAEKSIFTLNHDPSQTVTIGVKDGVYVPSFLFYVVEWLQNNWLQAPHADLSIFVKPSSASRHKAICRLIEDYGIIAALGKLDASSTEDSIELAQLFIEFFQRRPPIFRKELHGAIKGILSLNNATGSRISGVIVAEPSETIVRLLRDILLLIPSDCRMILNYILDFTSLIFKFTKLNPSSTRLVPLIGSLLVGSPTLHTSSSKLSDWSSCLCELLIITHSPQILDNNAAGATVRKSSNLWKIAPSFMRHIKEKIRLSETPRRSFTSPRKKTTPTRKLLFTPGRKLFQTFAKSYEINAPAPPLIESPSTLPIFAIGTGGKFFSSQTSAKLLERDTFGKRLRID